MYLTKVVTEKKKYIDKNPYGFNNWSKLMISIERGGREEKGKGNIFFKY